MLKLQIEKGREEECPTRNIISEDGKYVAFNVDKKIAENLVKSYNKEIQNEI